MAVDMFLKIPEIKGESTDSDPHLKDAMQVLSWSWGMTQSGSTHMGLGSGAGKVDVQNLSFTKYIDLATPNLLKACCAGTHYKTGFLSVRKAGDKPLEYLKIIFYDLLVAGVSTGGSGGEDRLTENVTLNFGQFEVDYTAQTSTGLKGVTIPMTWNIPGNTDKLNT